MHPELTLAMHAARLATLHDALFGLLVEQLASDLPMVDGVAVQFRYEGGETSLDIQYMSGGMPVAGEGA